MSFAPRDLVRARVDVLSSANVPGTWHVPKGTIGLVVHTLSFDWCLVLWRLADGRAYFAETHATWIVRAGLLTRLSQTLFHARAWHEAAAKGKPESRRAAEPR